jgi:hypothetical protein
MPRRLSQADIERINAEIAKERAEGEAKEDLLSPKVGRNAKQPHHPIFNPSREDEEQLAQSWRESVARDQREALSHSQSRHWKEAVRLIREGEIQSYADLGARFRKQKCEQQWARDGREDYTAYWAYLLVRRVVARGALTEEEIQRLIKDTSKPRRKQSTN